MSLRSRPGPRPAGFIEPCLPSARGLPPTGGNWLHEIKHDGFRLLARRDGARSRLFTRNGYDWTERFPLIRAGMAALKVRSCLIDGEAVCCEEDGVPSFQALRRRRNDSAVFLYAFDLLELDGVDLRPLPLEARRAASRDCSTRSSTGCTYPIMSRPRARPCFGTPACSESKASSPSERARPIGQDGRSTGSR
jgi:ATP-dependent DNA ligase